MPLNASVVWVMSGMKRDSVKLAVELIQEKQENMIQQAITVNVMQTLNGLLNKMLVIDSVKESPMLYPMKDRTPHLVIAIVALTGIRIDVS